MSNKGKIFKLTQEALVIAAVSGLFSGLASAESISADKISGSSWSNSVQALAGQMGGPLAAEAGKHDCKGKNGCAGQGGCKSGDNGCKGKNSCKGHGGCSTAN